MSKNKLKFDIIEVNKKEFHVSKQPIALDSVLINKIAVSEISEYSHIGLNILLATKMITSLDRYVLFYLKWVVHKIFW